MEPVSIILTALVLGVAAAVKPTAEQAVKDAYQGLKTVIQDVYKISLANFESRYSSKAEQAALEEHLTESGAADNEKLLDEAKALVELIKAHDSQTITTIGVDIEGVETGYIKAKKVFAATGSTGLKVRDSKVSKGMEFDDVSTGEPNDPK